MVVLVLDDACYQPVEVLLVKLAVFVKVLDVDVRLARHVLVDVGQAEAALAEHEIVAPFLGDDGVDESAFVDAHVGITFFKRFRVNDKYADGLAHLRTGQPHTVGVVHGLEHVSYEGLPVNRFLVHLFCNFSQYGFAVNVNW